MLSSANYVEQVDPRTSRTVHVLNSGGTSDTPALSVAGLQMLEAQLDISVQMVFWNHISVT